MINGVRLQILQTFVSVPETPVRWWVSSAGQLQVQWLERMAFFETETRVRLDWIMESMSGQVEGTVSKVKLDNLQLGGRYQITLSQLKSNVTTSFNFTACKLKLHFHTFMHTMG